MAKRPLVLCENMRAVPYVPFYLALAGGYWQSEGLDIHHVVSPATTNTPLKLLDGSADVSWGGPMRVMMHHDADPNCPLVCFGQVVAKDPFVLVGRSKKRRFHWSDLQGLRVAPAGDVPTPWMTFQDDLQRAGLNPSLIAQSRVRPMALNIQAYLQHEVDVVQLFEPYADQLVQKGLGHVWHRFTQRGDIGYTTFYATKKITTHRRDDCHSLVAGIAKAQKALVASSAKDVATAVAPFMPQLALDELTRIVQSYRLHGLWATQPDLPPSAYLRLKAALVSGGLIHRDPSYEQVVDQELSMAI